MQNKIVKKGIVKKGKDSLRKVWFFDNGIAINNKNTIAGFFGEQRFLSNFLFPAKTFYLGHEFPTSENAYQAAKYFIINGKWGDKLNFFQTCTNDESKKFWKDKRILPKKLKKWHAIRLQIMEDIVELKFNKNINPELHKMLVVTKNKKLEERNWWDDTFWGTNEKGKGENNLGKILMKVRKKFIKEK